MLEYKMNMYENMYEKIGNRYIGNDRINGYI